MSQRGSELLTIPHWIYLKPELLQADPMDKTTSEDSRTSSSIRVIAESTRGHKGGVMNKRSCRWRR